MERQELLTSNKKIWERALQAHKAKEVKGRWVGEGLADVSRATMGPGAISTVTEFASLFFSRGGIAMADIYHCHSWLISVALQTVGASVGDICL